MNAPIVPESPASDPAESPTTVRWRLLALLFAISVVTYVDRVNISVTARQMMPALGLTDQEMGYVFSAFVVGYALCQIPGGWLGDRWGVRRVLAGALVWWSVWTTVTATAPVLGVAAGVGVLSALIAVRFLLGIGESVALPNFNRTVADWLPQKEQALGIGIAIGGIGIGAAVTPPVTAWIMVNWGWQTAFYLAAVVGILVALLWHWYARDHPRDHPGVNQAELRLILDGRQATASENVTPWRRIVRTPTVWWLVVSYTCLGYVAYVYMTWLYLYLVNVRGFGELRGAAFAMAPFLAMLVGCPLGGWLTDRLTLRCGVTEARRLVGIGGMGLSGASIALGAWTDHPVPAVLWLSFGAGCLYFTVGAYWSSTVHLSRPHAGTLSGLMNTGANLGGSLSPTVTPWLADEFGWPAALGVAAGAACLGGLLWWWIRPGDGLSR
jgi:ACS family glucarate transporter-like MFS transporter